MDYKNLNLDSTRIGKKTLYHTGNLVMDRMGDKALNAFAEDIFNRSTAVINISEEEFYEASGEFVLYQKQVDEETYQYYFVRIKPCVNTIKKTFWTQ